MQLDSTIETDQHMGREAEFGTVNLSDGVLNNDEDTIKRNIITNINRGLPQLERYMDHPDYRPVALVAGGASLDDPESLQDLKEHSASGHAVVALNGSYKWLDDHNIRYHAHVLLDSRHFNKTFVQNPKKGVKYFICSQCDPAVFDNLIGYNTYIWHGGTSKFVPEEMEAVYHGKYIKVKTGRTVMLGALYVFRTLGFHQFELFGLDSCLLDSKHHAYDQKENDDGTIVEFVINGRTFQCHPWMIGQAQDFLKFTKILGHKYDINVHGNGLINHLITSISERGELVYDEANEWDNIVARYASQQQL